MVVASPGMSGFALRISASVVLKCAASAGGASPVWAMYSTMVPGGYGSRVGSAVGKGTAGVGGAGACSTASVSTDGDCGTGTQAARKSSTNPVINASVRYK